MAFYSRSRGWVSRAKQPIVAGPDPYADNSARFAERHRHTETVLRDGTVQVDMGEPVKRLPSEAFTSSSRLPAEPPLDREVEPEPDTPTTRRRPIHSRAHLEPYGINRGEVRSRNEND